MSQTVTALSSRVVPVSEEHNGNDHALVFGVHCVLCVHFL